jgi:hypothetical protein
MVISRDRIASLVAKPTAPYLDHLLVGLGLGRKERLQRRLLYLPGTRTICSIYITITKLKYATMTSLDTRQVKLHLAVANYNSKQLYNSNDSQQQQELLLRNTTIDRKK